MEKSQWDMKHIPLGSGKVTRLDDFVVQYEITHTALLKEYEDCKRTLERKVCQMNDWCPSSLCSFKVENSSWSLLFCLRHSLLFRPFFSLFVPPEFFCFLLLSFRNLAFNPCLLQQTNHMAKDCIIPPLSHNTEWKPHRTKLQKQVRSFDLVGHNPRKAVFSATYCTPCTPLTVSEGGVQSKVMLGPLLRTGRLRKE